MIRGGELCLYAEVSTENLPELGHELRAPIGDSGARKVVKSKNVSYEEVSQLFGGAGVSTGNEMSHFC